MSTALRISRCEASRHRLDLLSPLLVGAKEISKRDCAILRLYDGERCIGLGEASPAYWLGSPSVAECYAGLRRLRKLFGSGPLAAQSLRESASGMDLPAAAMFAVETALLDAESREAGLPAAAFLSEKAVGEVELSALIAAGDPCEIAVRARTLAAAGYRSFKLKVGTAAPAADRDRVRALREAIDGEGLEAGAASIRLDANRAWTFPQALAALRSFEPFGVDFIEEPLQPGPVEGIAELRSRVAIDVALDESVESPAQLEAALAAGAASVLVVKGARAGGVAACLAMARRASARGLRVVFTDSLESTVAMAATLHIAAAFYGELLDAGALGRAEAGAKARVEAEAKAGAEPRAKAEALGLGGAVMLSGHPFASELSTPCARVSLAGRCPGLGLDLSESGDE